MLTSSILRSLLFVPADNPAKLMKSKQASADALVIDLEDAVELGRKVLARALVKEFLQGRHALPQTVLVRLNQVAGEHFGHDCDAITGYIPDGIVLSKCESINDVLQLHSFLEKTDADRKCRIYPLIESARGILNAYSIASSSSRVAGLAFGAEDFSAEMGIQQTDEEIELLYARSALVTASRAAGCEAFDSPLLDFGDLQRLQNAAFRARNLGFSGKLAIHPAQIPVLNDVFSPTESEIREATRIIASYSAKGGGVLAVEGRMVDEASARRARRILEIAGAIQHRKKSR